MVAGNPVGSCYQKGVSSTPRTLRRAKRSHVLSVIGLLVVLLSACDELETIDIAADPSAGDTVSIVATADVPPAHANVVYRECATCDRSVLDVYASVEPSKGTLVFFHGGGFDGGAKELIILMGLIKSQTERGWTVVTPNYALAADGNPGSRANILADGAAVMDWVRSPAAAERGLRVSGPLVVAGHSAGGTIAGLLATSDAATDTWAIDGWVSISGVLSWSGGPDSAEAADTLHGGAGYGAAPADRFGPDTPPGYLIHGDQDRVVEWFNLFVAGFASAEAGGPHLTIDLVDVDRQTTSLGESRGHLPVGGANANRFNAWLDSLQAPG